MSLTGRFNYVRNSVKAVIDAYDGTTTLYIVDHDDPIIHAYRLRTPHLRTAWETQHILRYEDSKRMRKYFKKVDVRSFHLAVLAAVPLRDTPLFKPAQAVLGAVDSAILRIPGVRAQGWMACFLLSDPA